MVAILKVELENSLGSKAPDLSFNLLGQDESASLADYSGKTVLLNFWSENCPPCVELHPLLGKLQEDYAGKGLIVLYLSAHDTESQRRYFSKHAAAGLKGVVADWQGLKKPYQIFAKPSSLVIDADGIIRSAWFGSEKYSELKDRVVESW